MQKLVDTKGYSKLPFVSIERRYDEILVFNIGLTSI